VQSAGPPDLPPLSDPSFDGVPVRAFPIYQPPLPPAVEEDVDVNSLPSDKYLQKGIKIRLTRKATEDSPELTEEALRNFYRGLIESGREEGVDDFKGIEAPEGRLRLGRAKREEVLGRLERRLLGSTSQAASFASVAAKVPSTLVSVPTHHRLATILSSIAGPSSSAAVPIFSIKGKEKELMRASDVPLGLVSQREWDALFEEFVSFDKMSPLIAAG